MSADDGVRLLVSADLVERWAEDAVDAGEAGLLILKCVLSALIDRHEEELAKAVQAALLASTTSRVFPRTMLAEVGYARWYSS